MILEMAEHPSRRIQNVKSSAVCSQADKAESRMGGRGSSSFLFANRETTHSHEVCGKTSRVIQQLNLRTTNSRGKWKCWSISCARLSVIPWTVTHQSPLSMEFSRQEYWSCCHSLLQGIFLNRGLNPGLPHCRWILYCLSHQGSVLNIHQLLNIYYMLDTPWLPYLFIFMSTM